MNETIKDIKLGEQFSMVLNNDGELFVFGSNTDGQGLERNYFIFLFFFFFFIYFFLKKKNS